MSDDCMRPWPIMAGGGQGLVLYWILACVHCTLAQDIYQESGWPAFLTNIQKRNLEHKLKVNITHNLDIFHSFNLNLETSRKDIK